MSILAEYGSKIECVQTHLDDLSDRDCGGVALCPILEIVHAKDNIIHVPAMEKILQQLLIFPKSTNSLFHMCR